MATQTYPVPPPGQTQILNASETLINPATEETLQTLLGQSARSIRDTNNIRDPTSPLAAGEVFTGTYTDIRDHGVVTIFFLSDQPPAFTNGVDDTDGYEAYVEWSPDGITTPNPALDLLARTQVDIKVVNVAGFPTLYVGVDYLNQPHTNEFYRLYYENGPTAQSAVLSRIDAWLSKDAFTGSFGGLDEDLSDLSVALLTRSVIAGDVVDGLGIPTGDFENVRLSPSGALNTAAPNVELFRYATPDDGALPSGPDVGIDPIKNTEANYVDTGWFPSTLYPGGSRFLLRTPFGSGYTLEAFIANASDDQGSNAEGLAFPLADTAQGNVQVKGADFFDRYSRIVIRNISGTTATDFTARVVGSQVPQPGVTTSLSSTVFDFFPATLGVNALLGKVPNTNVMKLLEITTNGFLNTASEEFLREVSLGRVAGHSIEEIQGQSDAVGTTFEDVWFITGIQVEPTTADTLDISSTSPLDTAGGTGIREVRIRGVDGSHQPIEETLALNGLTPVTTVNSYLRVFEMSTTDVGSLDVSAGIITAIHAETLLPIVRMKSGVLNSAKSHFTIPAGKVGILVEEEVNSGVGDDADFRLQIREFGETAYRTTRLQSVSGGAVTRQVAATENIFPAKSDIRWQAKKIGIGTTRATVNYTIMLIDEGLI